VSEVEFLEDVFLWWRAMGGPGYKARNVTPKGPSLWYGPERGWESVKEKK
jgi:hypothetical protein